MTWSQSYYLATWSPTKCFLHWHAIPTCWQPPYWSLVISAPLCCQSMVLMSFWLCNALRSNTHKAIFPDTVFNQSDSHWACFSFLKLLSSVCLKSLFRSQCLLHSCFVLWFWILKRFCNSVPCLLWELFQIFHISLSLCLWAMLSAQLIISVTPQFQPCWSCVPYHRISLHYI